MLTIWLERGSPQQWIETGDEEPEFMYFHGSRCDRRPDKRATLTGRGSVGKAIVAGAVVRRPTLTPLNR